MLIRIFYPKTAGIRARDQRLAGMSRTVFKRSLDWCLRDNTFSFDGKSDDLVYTIEHPALDGTLPFLDILLHPDLSTYVYRKPTHTDSYTHYSTSSPQSTKDSLISSLTRRAYDVCSPQHLPHELEHIRSVLLDNGYPLSRIELVMRRTKQSIVHPASAPIKSDKQSAKVFILYYPHVNKQISSILQRHSVSSACTSNKNLRDLLSSAKSRQIPCKDC